MNTEELRALYARYLEEAGSLEKKKRFTDGLFGFGRRTADHPCHERLAADVHEAVRAMAGEGSPGLAEALRLIADAPGEHPEPPSIHWTLVAAQNAILGAVPALTPAEAAGLYAHFEHTHPRSRRMPNEEQILKALRERAGDI
ncbi:MAG: hypothetical protein IKP10_02930 [Clostridia bacterium]|nr:hypothetical protein [Clostridia bacterium]